MPEKTRDAPSESILENAAPPLRHQPAPAEKRTIDYGQLDQRIGYALRRAQIAVFQDFYRHVAAFDISTAQYSVLTILECNPGLSQTQVSEALGIKKTNFVALIKELENRGLARREAIPNDRRSFALHLTEAGETLIGTLHAALARHEAGIRAAIGAEAYDSLFAPLRTMARALRGEAGE